MTVVWSWIQEQILNRVGGFILGWFNLPKDVAELKKLNSANASTDKRLCPNCDQRMTVLDARRFDIWYYKCTPCDASFRYPAPTARQSANPPR